MIKNRILIVLFAAVLFFTSLLCASANTLAPDRSQQVLDLLAVECQNISDYANFAQYGDTSRFNSVKEHIAVTINNISLLMNGYDNNSISQLWNMYNQFMPDPQSAQNAVNVCTNVRGNIYRKISNDKSMNQQHRNITTFEECAKAGYHVNGGTCFIGGNSVFDSNGNLIGYYYSDCFDNTGFHMGSCWDCFYGANHEGCIEKR